VARFVPRADRFFDPNSSFDGRLGSIATLHPTVRTSDGLRAGGVMRQYFEGSIKSHETGKDKKLLGSLFTRRIDPSSDAK
jgi:hypothetical protein